MSNLEDVLNAENKKNLKKRLQKHYGGVIMIMLNGIKFITYVVGFGIARFLKSHLHIARSKFYFHFI